MQPGEVPKPPEDAAGLERAVGFRPNTRIAEGHAASLMGFKATTFVEVSRRRTVSSSSLDFFITASTQRVLDFRRQPFWSDGAVILSFAKMPAQQLGKLYSMGSTNAGDDAERASIWSSSLSVNTISMHYVGQASNQRPAERFRWEMNDGDSVSAPPQYRGGVILFARNTSNGSDRTAGPSPL
jgi:hypothetical protein